MKNKIVPGTKIVWGLCTPSSPLGKSSQLKANWETSELNLEIYRIFHLTDKGGTLSETGYLIGH